MVQQLESAVPPLNEMKREVTLIRFLCHGVCNSTYQIMLDMKRKLNVTTG